MIGFLRSKYDTEDKSTRIVIPLEYRIGFVSLNDAKECIEDIKTFLNVKLDRPGSPASDGVIKLYLSHGQEIIDYVRTYIDGYNAYTAHDDAADIAKEKTDDKWQYKFDKLAKEKERAANKAQRPITIDADKQAEFEKRQADAIARRDAMLARRNK